MNRSDSPPRPVKTIVAVDIGNSRIKLYCYSARHSGTRPAPDRLGLISLPGSPQAAGQDVRALLERLVAPAFQPAHWFASSVNREGEKWFGQLFQSALPGVPYSLLGHTDMPLKIDVEAPERVGTDRLLAAVAGNHLRDQQEPAIIVDAGSAITVDLVCEGGAFRGGSILPGVSTQLRSLAQETDALPEVDASSTLDVEVVGRSTEEAIRSGVFLGVVHAVEGIAGRLAQVGGETAPVFVTGGDRLRFSGLPKAVVVEDLVGLGIYFTARQMLETRGLISSP